MGNSSSSEVNQTIDTKNINKNMLEDLNQQITDSMTESIVKTQTEAGTAIVQEGKQKIGPIIAKGKGSRITNIKLTVDQNAQINLNSDDKSIQNNNISSELALSIVKNVSSKVSNENMAKLVGEAEASQSVGAFNPTGGNEVSSEVNAKISTLNLTESYRKFTNLVTNKIVQNTESLNFKQCIVNTLQQADQEAGGIYAVQGGEVSGFEMNIGQTTSVIQSCIFDTVQSSGITSQIANSLGMTVTDTSESKTTSEIESKAKSKQTIQGVMFSSSGLGSLILFIIIGFAIYKFMEKSDFSSFNRSSGTQAVTEEDEGKGKGDEQEGGRRRKRNRKFVYSNNPIINTVTKALIFLSKV